MRLGIYDGAAPWRSRRVSPRKKELTKEDISMNSDYQKEIAADAVAAHRRDPAHGEEEAIHRAAARGRRFRLQVVSRTKGGRRPLSLSNTTW
jgi:hypothetical protein